MGYASLRADRFLGGAVKRLWGAIVPLAVAGAIALMSAPAFLASGFPSGFIARHTAAAQGAAWTIVGFIGLGMRQLVGRLF